MSKENRWSPGEPLAKSWLDTQIVYNKDRTTYQSGGKFYDNRKIEKVDPDGYALISGTADLYLAPRVEYFPDELSKDEWKKGDILPQAWLETQITYFDPKSSHGDINTNKNKSFGSDRFVTSVHDGYALISGTSTVYLPPKHLCANYPSPPLEQVWKVGDKLPMSWLRTQKCKHPTGTVFNQEWMNKNDRKVSQVKDDGRAVISGGTIHLPKKSECTGYQEEWNHKEDTISPIPAAKPATFTGWKMGDKLPMKWLETQRPVLHFASGEKFTGMWQNSLDRYVIEVSQEGKAKVSDSKLILPPKSKCTGYDDNWNTKPNDVPMPGKDEPVGWKIGDYLIYKDNTGEGWKIVSIENGKVKIQLCRDGTHMNYSLSHINGYVKSGEWIHKSEGAIGWKIGDKMKCPSDLDERGWEIMSIDKTIVKIKLCDGASMNYPLSMVNDFVANKSWVLIDSKPMVAIGWKTGDIFVYEAYTKDRSHYFMMYSLIDNTVKVKTVGDDYLVTYSLTQVNDFVKNGTWVKVTSSEKWDMPEWDKKVEELNSNNKSQLKPTQNVRNNNSSRSNEAINIRRTLKAVAGHEGGEAHPARSKVQLKVTKGDY